MWPELQWSRGVSRCVNVYVAQTKEYHEEYSFLHSVNYPILIECLFDARSCISWAVRVQTLIRQAWTIHRAQFMYPVLYRVIPDPFISWFELLLPPLWSVPISHLLPSLTALTMLIFSTERTWGPGPFPAYCAYNVANILSAYSTPGAKDMANGRMQEWMIGATGASLRHSIRGMTWPLPPSQSPQGPHSLFQPHWSQLLGPHGVHSCTGCVSYVENLSLCATSTHPAALGLSVTSSRMPSPSDHHRLNPHQSPNRTN